MNANTAIELYIFDEYGCLLLIKEADGRWNAPRVSPKDGETADAAALRRLRAVTNAEPDFGPKALSADGHAFVAEQRRVSAPERLYVSPADLNRLQASQALANGLKARLTALWPELSAHTRLLDERLLSVRPSARQLRHQALEFYGFIHFGMNTFTDREWGDGTEPESLFAPSALDTDQWAAAARAAGMRGLILTAKHHDGFCLWPSACTEHSVKNAPVTTDVVGSLAESCRRAGLAFGVYLSPWDRNDPLYGQGKPYDDYFVMQLTELCTRYGELFCVWLDGACGEGPNGKKQRYDWDRYYATVRALQPNACLCVCGPDVRWCGNEAGRSRSNEWSVVPERLRLAERVQAESQHEDGRPPLKSWDEDLGSRERLRGEDALCWYPAEVNVSIRPGWFYHAAEDNQVKSPETLLQMYLSSVGGNASFLLNLPPDTRGLLADADVQALRGLGETLRSAFARDLAKDAELSTDGLSLRWREPQAVSYVVLREDTAQGQRVERFTLYADEKPVARGGAVGMRKIVALPEGTKLNALRLSVEDSRGPLRLLPLKVY